MLCLFCWGGLGVGWEAVPGKPEGQRVSGCIARTLCPLLKPLLLPAAPPSARSFACDTKPLGFPLSQDVCTLGMWGQAAPRSPTRGWQEPSGSLWAMCVCLSVPAWSLLRLLELGTVPTSVLARLYAACARCHSKGAANPMGSERGIPIPGRHPGTSCEAVVLVLMGLEVPRSPCPALAALPGWMLGQAGMEHTEVPASPCFTKPV